MTDFLAALSDMLSNGTPTGLTSIFGQGQAQQPQTQAPAGGMNYGAAPTAQGIGGQVLARLKQIGLGGSALPSGPLGQTPPIGGNDLAAAVSGLSSVDTTASKGGAFFQGLAGGLAARRNAEVQDQTLGMNQSKNAVEAFKQLLEAKKLQDQLSGRQAGQTAYQGALSGGAQAQDQASTPAPVTMGQDASAPAPQASTGSAPASAAPIPTTAPTGQGAAASFTPQIAGGAPAAGGDGAVPMIPHRVAMSSDFWSTVAPESNPAFLDRRAGAAMEAARVGAADPEYFKAMQTQANQDLQRAAQIRGTGLLSLKDGSTVLAPGYAQAKGAASAIETAAQESAKANFELVDTQPIPGGPIVRVPKAQVLATSQAGGGAPTGAGVGSPQPQGAPGVSAPPMPPIPIAPAASSSGAGADGQQPTAVQPLGGPTIAKQPAYMTDAQKQMVTNENAMSQQFQQRQVSQERAQAMLDILKTYKPGAYAEQKADLVAKMRGLGFNMPDSATANPAAFEEFYKSANANVLSDLKDQGGGQPLVSEMEALKKSNANPGLQPEANATILARSLGVAQYKDQHYRDYLAWKQANPYATDPGQFETAWAAANPVSKFTDASLKRTSYLGQNIPPFGQRVTGQTYLTPNGTSHVWLGSGWGPANGR